MARTYEDTGKTTDKGHALYLILDDTLPRPVRNVVTREELVAQKDAFNAKIAIIDADIAGIDAL